MTTNEKIRNQIAQNNDRMEWLQQQAMQILERIEHGTYQTGEDAQLAMDTLDYDIRQLVEVNADRNRIWEINRMLEYFTKGDDE